MAHYTGDNPLPGHWLCRAHVAPCGIGPDVRLNGVATAWKLKDVARSGSLAVGRDQDQRPNRAACKGDSGRLLWWQGWSLTHQLWSVV